MSQLLCYWEEADRCLNQGEMKIKIHWPLGKLLLKFSSHNTAFMLVNQPLFCSISDYSLSWQMLLTSWTHHEKGSQALGYQIALLLHPVNGVPNWWQIIVLKKFLKNCVLLNLYTLKNYEICRFNKNKNYAIGQLNP